MGSLEFKLAVIRKQQMNSDVKQGRINKRKQKRQVNFSDNLPPMKSHLVEVTETSQKVREESPPKVREGSPLKVVGEASPKVNEYKLTNIVSIEINPNILTDLDDVPSKNEI
jgi:hypothetical protein